MTEKELQEIRARAEAATEGPWEWRKLEYDEDDSDTEMPWLDCAGDDPVMDFGDCEQYYPTEGTPPNEADAEFIAAARQDVPKLLAEVERLRTVIEDAISIGEMQHENFLFEPWASLAKAVNGGANE